MNLEIKQEILNKIKAYDKIVISRHQRPDGDAVGSTMGLMKILKLTYPEKKIVLVGEDVCDYVSFLGEELSNVSDEEMKESLLIVLDTGNTGRISNSRYEMAKEIIKIDHHVEVEKYGDVQWVEDFRSSVCEMVVDFYVTFKDELKIDKDAALCLYTGMVTDSGRFQYSETTGETLRLAGVLLDMGIDTQTLYARLYLEEFDYLKFQSYVFGQMKLSKNGVAYVYVDKKMQEEFSLSHEQASNVVSLLSGIKGSIIWLAFIDNEDGTTRVRLRSRFVTINKLAEKYGGGGHACASGATVHSPEEMQKLIDEADELIKDYKTNNFYL